jgi:hypothetical protein
MMSVEIVRIVDDDVIVHIPFDEVIVVIESQAGIHSCLFPFRSYCKVLPDIFFN